MVIELHWAVISSKTDYVVGLFIGEKPIEANGFVVEPYDPDIHPPAGSNRPVNRTRALDVVSSPPYDGPSEVSVVDVEELAKLFTPFEPTQEQIEEARQMQAAHKAKTQGTL